MPAMRYYMNGNRPHHKLQQWTHTYHPPPAAVQPNTLLTKQQCSILTLLVACITTVVLLVVLLPPTGDDNTNDYTVPRRATPTPVAQTTTTPTLAPIVVEPGFALIVDSLTLETTATTAVFEENMDDYINTLVAFVNIAAETNLLQQDSVTVDITNEAPATTVDNTFIQIEQRITVPTAQQDTTIDFLTNMDLHAFSSLLQEVTNLGIVENSIVRTTDATYYTAATTVTTTATTTTMINSPDLQSDCVNRAGYSLCRPDPCTQGRCFADECMSGDPVPETTECYNYVDNFIGICRANNCIEGEPIPITPELTMECADRVAGSPCRLSGCELGTCNSNQECTASNEYATPDSICFDDTEKAGFCEVAGGEWLQCNTGEDLDIVVPNNNIDPIYTPYCVGRDDGAECRRLPCKHGLCVEETCYQQNSNFDDGTQCHHFGATYGICNSNNCVATTTAPTTAATTTMIDLSDLQWNCANRADYALCRQLPCTQGRCYNGACTRGDPVPETTECYNDADNFIGICHAGSCIQGESIPITPELRFDCANRDVGSPCRLNGCDIGACDSNNQCNFANTYAVLDTICFNSDGKPGFCVDSNGYPVCNTGENLEIVAPHDNIEPIYTPYCVDRDDGAACRRLPCAPSLCVEETCYQLSGFLDDGTQCNDNSPTYGICNNNNCVTTTAATTTAATTTMIDISDLQLYCANRADYALCRQLPCTQGRCYNGACTRGDPVPETTECYNDADNFIGICRAGSCIQGESIPITPELRFDCANRDVGSPCRLNGCAIGACDSNNQCNFAGTYAFLDTICFNGDGKPGFCEDLNGYPVCNTGENLEIVAPYQNIDPIYTPNCVDRDDGAACRRLPCAPSLCVEETCYQLSGFLDDGTQCNDNSPTYGICNNNNCVATTSTAATTTATTTTAATTTATTTTAATTTATTSTAATTTATTTTMINRPELQSDCVGRDDYVLCRPDPCTQGRCYNDECMSGDPVPETTECYNDADNFIGICRASECIEGEPIPITPELTMECTDRDVESLCRISGCALGTCNSNHQCMGNDGFATPDSICFDDAEKPGFCADAGGGWSYCNTGVDLDIVVQIQGIDPIYTPYCVDREDGSACRRLPCKHGLCVEGTCYQQNSNFGDGTQCHYSGASYGTCNSNNCEATAAPAEGSGGGS